jgi:hypothetical protein
LLMVAQRTCPLASVVRALVEEQDGSVVSVMPPVRTARPAKVEVAVAAKVGAWTPLVVLMKVVVPLVKLAMPLTANKEPGVVVPMPTFPELATMKFWAVEEPTTNCGTLVPGALAFTERSAQGVVVATPMKPLLSIARRVEVAVPLVDEEIWNKRGAVPVAASSEKMALGEEVPIPTSPPLVTRKSVPPNEVPPTALEEPMAKAGPAIAFGFTEKRPQGEVVPTPTTPLPSTLNRVAFVVEATANKDVFADDWELVETESWLKGVVVPMPIALVVAEEPMVGWVQAS